MGVLNLVLQDGKTKLPCFRTKPHATQYLATWPNPEKLQRADATMHLELATGLFSMKTASVAARVHDATHVQVQKYMHGQSRQYTCIHVFACLADW